MIHTYNAYSLSSLMEKDPTSGVALVPLRALFTTKAGLDLQDEVDDWYPIVWNHVAAAPPESSVEELLNGVVFGSTREKRPSNGNNGTVAQVGRAAILIHYCSLLAPFSQVRVRCQLDLRRAGGGKPSSEDKELSSTVVEVLSGEVSSSSTFSTLWNMRENVQVTPIKTDSLNWPLLTLHCLLLVLYICM